MAKIRNDCDSGAWKSKASCCLLLNIYIFFPKPRFWCIVVCFYYSSVLSSCLSGKSVSYNFQLYFHCHLCCRDDCQGKTLFFFSLLLSYYTLDFLLSFFLHLPISICLSLFYLSILHFFFPTLFHPPPFGLQLFVLSTPFSITFSSSSFPYNPATCGLISCTCTITDGLLDNAVN